MLSIEISNMCLHQIHFIKDLLYYQTLRVSKMDEIQTLPVRGKKKKSLVRKNKVFLHNKIVVNIENYN